MFRLWLKFNAVGIAGLGVQLLALIVLTTGLGLHYLMATLVAVETALLHNFAWHERWSWAERTRLSTRGVSHRLIRIQQTSGLISTGGNLLLMWLSAARLRLHG